MTAPMRAGRCWRRLREPIRASSPYDLRTMSGKATPRWLGFAPRAARSSSRSMTIFSICPKKSRICSHCWTPPNATTPYSVCPRRAVIRHGADLRAQSPTCVSVPCSESRRRYTSARFVPCGARWLSACSRYPGRTRSCRLCCSKLRAELVRVRVTHATSALTSSRYSLRKLARVPSGLFGALSDADRRSFVRFASMIVLILVVLAYAGFVFRDAGIIMSILAAAAGMLAVLALSLTLVAVLVERRVAAFRRKPVAAVVIRAMISGGQESTDNAEPPGASPAKRRNWGKPT